MDINRGNMNALFTGFSMQFRNAFGLAPNTYEQFAMSVPAGTQIVEYPFLEAFGGMREWIGDKQIKNISSKKLTVKERPFEDTIGVKKRDIETDNLGVYSPLIAQLGFNAGKLWNELAYEALCANGTWLDGADFFGTSRKYGKNTISNKTTNALSAATYATARTTMMSYIGHNGKSMGVVPSLLVVGPKLEDIAKDIVGNNVKISTIATGESSYVAPVAGPNNSYGTSKLLVSTDLVGDYDDYWFLLAMNGPIKPVLVQKGKEPNLTRLDRDTDEIVFMQGKALYSVEAYGEAALAFPHLAYAGIL